MKEQFFLPEDQERIADAADVFIREKQRVSQRLSKTSPEEIDHARRIFTSPLPLSVSSEQFGEARQDLARFLEEDHGHINSLEELFLSTADVIAALSSIGRYVGKREYGISYKMIKDNDVYRTYLNVADNGVWIERISFNEPEQERRNFEVRLLKARGEGDVFGLEWTPQANEGYGHRRWYVPGRPQYGNSNYGEFLRLLKDGVRDVHMAICDES